MMRAILVIGLTAFACGVGYAQSTEAPTFDAVSVKVAQAPNGRGSRVAFFGGPGTKTPDRINVENYGMAALISRAYGVEYYQVTGPDWLTAFGSEKYNIVASIPSGTKEAQFRVMMQNLLAERFHLQLHRETKELPIYTLSVAKNGPKLKKAVPDPPPDANADAARSAGGGKMKMDSEGYPVLGPGMSMAIMNDHARMANKGHMQVLVSLLTGQTGRPVVDATGLTEEYEFALYWIPQPPGADPSMAEDPKGPDLFAALQQQMGLKLEPKKGPVEMLVIDHADRVPTEN
jgi:uncharacterized protein (TIGR03435 family)